MIGPKDYTYLTIVGPGPVGWGIARQSRSSPHAQVIATATHESHAIEIARALTAQADADRAAAAQE